MSGSFKVPSTKRKCQPLTFLRSFEREDSLPTEYCSGDTCKPYNQRLDYLMTFLGSVGKRPVHPSRQCRVAGRIGPQETKFLHWNPSSAVCSQCDLGYITQCGHNTWKCAWGQGLICDLQFNPLPIVL